MSRIRIRLKTLIILALVFLLVDTAGAARVKDLVNIEGVRNNQLIGFGLVIGLRSTGDTATNVFFSIQAIVNMLTKLGITVPANRVDQLQFKNVATVMVTADLPAFARQGDRIDVLVSSLGNAKSLQGGTLLLSPLKGADGNTYVLAQGPLSIGGFAVQGAARGVQKNHLLVGRIANGGLVEKGVANTLKSFNAKKEVFLSLKTADFTTADRVSRVINSEMKEALASTMNSRVIRIKVPHFYKENTSGFVTKIEGLEVRPDTSAKVIVDERTGTVVMGENVRISTVAVAHGALFVQIREEPTAVQPAPLSEGETAIIPRTRVAVDEGEDRLLVVPTGIGIGDVVNALNSIGVTPRDLISILQAIKAAGALHAELELM
ncbi:MAG: flagellar basal body P-ring protein FlgI [Nitrospinota bacterium]|nr:flagellar basal body P-ring protein FlgI [Nitrospinota bacterium]